MTSLISPRLPQFGQRACREHQVPSDIPIQRAEHVAVDPRLLHVGRGQEAREGMDVAAEVGYVGVRRRERRDVVCLGANEIYARIKFPETNLPTLANDPTDHPVLIVRKGF